MKFPLLVFALVLPCFAAERLRPLETPGAWAFGDPAAWTWSKTDAGPVLTLKQQQNFKPAVRSPFNLAWLTTVDWKSFTLTVEAQLTKFDASNNDLCIAFARQDENRFYYTHLGEKADGVHHQIPLVENADRRPITATRTEGTPWKPGTWHRLKLTYDASSGNIKVYFDDMNKPILTAVDRTLSHGWIGIGSFDDLGEFRNLEIAGEGR